MTLRSSAVLSDSSLLGGNINSSAPPIPFYIKNTVSQGPWLEDRRPFRRPPRDPLAKRVDVGQSFKTFGYECTSCWGDVGAGDAAEVDVIYISFIVSVQYIGYLIPYRDKVQEDN